MGYHKEFANNSTVGALLELASDMREVSKHTRHEDRIQHIEMLHDISRKVREISQITRTTSQNIRAMSYNLRKQKT